MIFGSAIHEATEAYFTSLKDGCPHVEPELHAIFDARFSEELELASLMHAPLDCGKDDIDAARTKGAEMLTTFLEKVDHTIKVVGVEVPISIELPTGHNMIGFIDLIADDGNDRYRVIDIKTAARSYGPDKIDYDMQPTVYLEAARRILGVESGVDFEYWVLTKTKVPKFEVVPVHRTERDWLELLETVEDVQQGISANAYHRRRGWQCDGCQYRKRCGS